MTILDFNLETVGQAGQVPKFIYFNTNDTIAEVTTAGYLNKFVEQGNQLNETDMAVVVTRTTPNSRAAQVAILEVSFSGGNWSFVPTGSPGSVVLPTIASHIATYTNTTGTLSEDAATAINGGNIQAGLSGTAGYLASFPATAARGSLRLVGAVSVGNTVTQITNASQAAARVYTIPDGGQSASSFLLTDSGTTQTIATGNLALSAGSFTASGAITSTAGNITSGSSGDAGTFISFPATAANGTLIVAAANAGGAFNTTVSNGTMGQSSVISIPDPGAATANFLLDTGAGNIIAKQQFVGINDVLTFGTGTWTTTRVAQGNYVSRHTAGDETSIIAIDITPAIVAAASKGFRLDSFDYIYSIATLAMDAHSATLDRIAYANNVAVSVTSVPITATLATATQANPYLTNCTVTTPAFDVTADSKYVLEITANNAATTDYDFYGIMLRFSQTVA